MKRNSVPSLADKRPSIEVADIFREHIADYRRKYRMPLEHLEVVYDILSCRTAYLGGHIERCDHCGQERYAYNSCRNRHCPKCQAMTKERWLERRRAELLPVIYFHNVFTLPHTINPVVLCNKRVMLNMLFKSASQTLLSFGRNPGNGLGGDLGFSAFLHTWDQMLGDHFHIHCIVPGGALDGEKRRWSSCKNGYLFPEKTLSMVFRGKFMDHLKSAYEKGEIEFPGTTAVLGTPHGFKALTDKLWSQNWVVDIEEPIQRPEYVLEYVARYTHRVAISNDRILGLKDGVVSFRYKNREKKSVETCQMEAVEFIRRFLMHVLPKGFMRIRYYGFLGNRCKRENIAICRKLLGVVPDLSEPKEMSIEEMMLKLTGTDITKCRKCRKGTMHMVDRIPKRSGQNAYFILFPEEFMDTG